MKYKFVKVLAIALGIAITFQNVAYSAFATEGMEISTEMQQDQSDDTMDAAVPELYTAPAESENAVSETSTESDQTSETINSETQSTETETPEVNNSEQNTETSDVEEGTENAATEEEDVTEEEVTEEEEELDAYPTGYPNTWVNTGNGAADIVGVARTQLGYSELVENHTKYNVWYYGEDKSVAWCAIFISWCANQAGISTSVLRKNASASGTVASRNSNPFGCPGYTFGSVVPQPGDIIFVDNSGSASSGHVGLVVSVDSNYIYTIEGNSSDKVSSLKYSRSSGRRVWGTTESTSYILFFGRPNYAGNSYVAPTPENPATNFKPGTYSVDASSLYVRSGPSSDNSALGTVKDGEEITVTEVSGEWGKITYLDKTGWVNLNYCALLTTVPQPAGTTEGAGTYRITGDSLNVREGAGTAYAVIGTVKKDQEVEITLISDGWGRFNYQGQIGWISLKYCTLISTTTPATTTTTTTTEATTTTTTESPVPATTSGPDASIGTYKVTASSLTVRSGAGTSYSQLGTLKNGELVDVIKDVNGWAMIAYKGQYAYVSMKYLELQTPSTTTTTTEKTTTTTTESTTTTTRPTTTTTTTTQQTPANTTSLGIYKVNCSGLKVRSGAGSSYKELGSLSNGTEVEIIKSVNGWGMIEYNNQVGYIYMSYVVRIGDAATTTEKQTTTTTEKTTTTTTEKPTTTTTEKTTTTTQTPQQGGGSYKLYKTTTGLNVRSGPASTYSILGVATKDTEVKVYSITGDWATIDWNGKTAYVSVKYLTYVGEGTNTPAVLAIQTQPVNTVVSKLGDTAKLSVAVSGDGLTYQWYYCNASDTVYRKASVTTNTYSASVTSTTNGQKVYCVIKDAYGKSVTTNTVTISVFEAVKIIEQPKSVVVTQEGKNATISVKATGTGLTYQWYYRNAQETTWHLSTVTSNTYVTPVIAARNGRQIFCIVKDANGNKVTTNTATMSIKGNLLLVTAPTNVVVAKKGDYANIITEAAGEGVTYTWYFCNPGETTFYKSSVTGTSYRYPVTDERNGRKVYCVITDTYGNKITTKTVTMSYAK